MDAKKIGELIYTLRKEKGYTQKQLAAQLHISDRTVSKWERGQGCPDISLLPNLGVILDVQIEKILDGEIQKNEFVGGNMKKSNFYVCKTCQNIVVATGSPMISCCDRPLELLVAQKATDEHRLLIEQVENEWYITSTHPMTKEHYISFIAFATGEQVQLVKQYPEWTLQTRMPKKKHGIINWYCTQHGLFYQLL